MRRQPPQQQQHRCCSESRIWLSRPASTKSDGRPTRLRRSQRQGRRRRSRCRRHTYTTPARWGSRGTTNQNNSKPQLNFDPWAALLMYNIKPPFLFWISFTGHERKRNLVLRMIWYDPKGHLHHTRLFNITIWYDTCVTNVRKTLDYFRYWLNK